MSVEHTSVRIDYLNGDTELASPPKLTRAEYAQWAQDLANTLTEKGILEPAVEIAPSSEKSRYGNTPVIIPGSTVDDPKHTAALVTTITRMAGSEYSHCIFAMGGAGGVSEKKQKKIQKLFSSLMLNVSQNVPHLLVGDGGTNSGIMKANGLARRQVLDEGGKDMTLLGVCPLEAVTYPGWEGSPVVDGGSKAGVDMNHAIVIPVQTVGSVPSYGTWGKETDYLCRRSTREIATKPTSSLYTRKTNRR